MSEIRVTNIIGETGTDAVNFTKGINVSSGVITATTFSGSGASLTSLPAGNLTGTLPAISGANLTGIAQKVKQVKTLIRQATASTSSATQSDIGMQLQITPTSTSNTILILTGMLSMGSANDTTSCVHIMMDSGNGFYEPEETRGPDRNNRTRVHTGRGYQPDNSDIYRAMPVMLYAMITPDNTNQHTIKLQWRQPDTNGATIYLNMSSSDNNAAWVTSPQSTMTVMEVDVS
jgi:hypothetical protein